MPGDLISRLWMKVSWASAARPARYWSVVSALARLAERELVA
jgi:hypothetical protein